MTREKEKLLKTISKLSDDSIDILLGHALELKKEELIMQSATTRYSKHEIISFDRYVKND